LAHRLLQDGHELLIFDNLSRPGAERNLRWLRQTHGSRVQVQIADVRDGLAVRLAVAQADQVFHFAAQVAAASLTNPVQDFEVNARGTLNLLEALRALESPPPLLFTSTGKVYGALEDIPLRLAGTRCVPTDEAIRAHGISERQPLDFRSPYGCSKGAADQYVLDAARTFGLPGLVFRLSCIYGPRQVGDEDQGWVAHFLRRAIEGQPVTLYGDGMQVRDVLFIDDLIEAFLLAMAHMPALAGQAFNIGGGPANTISLLELLDIIGEIHTAKPSAGFGPGRPGDQRYYVTDIRKFAEATGWQPRVSAFSGIERHYQWLLEEGRDEAAPASLADMEGVS
jgi:CDP-paratose 2-epimerase